MDADTRERESRCITRRSLSGKVDHVFRVRSNRENGPVHVKSIANDEISARRGDSERRCGLQVRSQFMIWELFGLDASIIARSV